MWVIVIRKRTQQGIGNMEYVFAGVVAIGFLVLVYLVSKDNSPFDNM